VEAFRRSMQLGLKIRPEGARNTPRLDLLGRGEFFAPRFHYIPFILYGNCNEREAAQKALDGGMQLYPPTTGWKSCDNK